ncbi:septal ring lytic transglycosylase RlpA family protein [Clostridium bowmanii]|uniref:RlpA-like double-psi beta-barrel domain-containing protein n=1 Tax=Clostridium bowmanii TaxID=132925 RepID=UPI001C0C7C63|nr:RlpA-like double-psi beta-barrel domain-containing protein [Clostridium bowmanii]MBU3188204.1 septal ring lytic transglycosylase RlpA family protein [Clostridium bowmanii]MCA1072386.1 septal ring lytic transglycosylase RlpA family protein [Clostridium bowmanii]
MKKFKGLVCLTLALGLVQSSMVFAVENLNTSERIPSYMEPGSVIQYNSNREMSLFKKGTTANKLNSSNYEPSSDLPKITANMTVIYDALGGPIVVIPKSKSDLNVVMKEVKLTSTDKPMIATTQTQIGTISWFDIWAEDYTFTHYYADDGAAHRTIAAFTPVSVVNASNKKYTTVRILDRGTYVNGRILDMAKYSFNLVAKESDGLFRGSIG